MLTADAAHDLAFRVSFEWSAEDEEVLAPLVDATLVWADDRDLSRIAAPAVATLWESGLRDDIESAVAKLAPDALEDVRADLAAGPHRSRFARAVVKQAAVELLPMHCLLCVEEGIVHGGDARPRALSVARVAASAAAIPEEEWRRAFGAAALSPSTPAVTLATDERRLRVRARLRNLAELGRESVPALSAALCELLDEPLPAPEDDEIWHEAVAGLEDRVRAELN